MKLKYPRRPNIVDYFSSKRIFYKRDKKRIKIIDDSFYKKFPKINRLYFFLLAKLKNVQS